MAAQFPEYTNPDYTIPGVKAPGQDLRGNQAVQQQANDATQFRANLPNYSNFLTDQYTQQLRQQLAGNLTSAKQTNNQRGLLYSGKRYGDEAAAQSDAANQYMQGAQQINQGLLNQADQLDQGVVNSGFAIAGQGDNSANLQQNSGIQQMLYNLQQEQLRNQAVAGLGGALGSGIGAFYPTSQPSVPNITPTSSYTSGVNFPDVLSGYYEGVA